MNKASPHTAQPHSGHSPSATSGQLADSPCSCSKGCSALHPLQYIVSWIILATSSVRCNMDVQEIK